MTKKMTEKESLELTKQLCLELRDKFAEKLDGLDEESYAEHASAYIIGLTTMISTLVACGKGRCLDHSMWMDLTKFISDRLNCGFIQLCDEAEKEFFEAMACRN